MRAQLDSSMREGPRWVIRDDEQFYGSANSKELALLFASAPDLLDALIKVRNELRYQLEFEQGTIDDNAYPELAMADAAIKKARGEA